MQFTESQLRELAVMRFDAVCAEFPFGQEMVVKGFTARYVRDRLNSGTASGLPLIKFPDDTFMYARDFFRIAEREQLNFHNATVAKLATILLETQDRLWARVKPQAAAAQAEARPNAGILQLARTSSAIDAIRQDLIRCGFELEFQALNGDSDSEPEVDYEALRDASAEAWSGLSFSETIRLVKYQDHIAGKVLEIVREEYPHKCFHELVNLFDGDLHSKVEYAVDEAETEFRDRWEEDNRDGYMESSNSDPYENLDVTRKTKGMIDCGTDQSVDGGEIRTVGALTPMQFLYASADLLENNEFEVDTGCSFHIHLSVPGVRHSYGSQLQAEMIAYILDNKARLPESVRDRLVSEKLDHFAQLRISTEKFTAVHFHQEQRTWEFRLFGNVSDSADARRCLIIAIEALRWAYRVKLGMETSLVTKEVMNNFRSVARRAREEDSSFVKERRKVSIEANNAA